MRHYSFRFLDEEIPIENIQEPEQIAQHLGKYIINCQSDRFLEFLINPKEKSNKYKQGRHWGGQRIGSAIIFPIRS